jgi:hypothetical protein
MLKTLNYTVPCIEDDHFGLLRGANCKRVFCIVSAGPELEHQSAQEIEMFRFSSAFQKGYEILI